MLKSTSRSTIPVYGFEPCRRCGRGDAAAVNSQPFTLHTAADKDNTEREQVERLFQHVSCCQE